MGHQKYRVTLAHRDALPTVKGYPVVVAPEDLLLPLDGGTIGIDGAAHRIQTEEEEITTKYDWGVWGQSTVGVERATTNLVTDTGAQVFNTNWTITPAGGDTTDEEKPNGFQGTTQETMFHDSIGGATATLYSDNFTSVPQAGDSLMQSCWIRTDATYVRFSYYSDQTGHHYTSNIAIENERWAFQEAEVYEVQSADVASGGQFRQFYIETAPNATYLYVFRPQLEVGDFATTFVDGSRPVGKLIYTSSYVFPPSFTIMGWFYIWHHNSDTNALFSICSNAGAFNRLVAYSDATQSDKLIIKGSNATDELLNITTDYEVPEATWFHFAITFDGTTYRIYINGVEEADKVEPRQINFLQTSNLYLGTFFDQHIMNGYINDFLITSRVFSEIYINDIAVNEMPIYNPFYYIAQV